MLSRQLPGMPLGLEPGTPNIPLLAGLEAALQWWEMNRDAYNEFAHHLGHDLRVGLRRLRGVQVCDPDRHAPRVPIVSFGLPGWKLEDLGRTLAHEYGIYARTGLHCAPFMHKALGSQQDGTVRFSLSGLNTEEEVEMAVAAVRELAARGKPVIRTAPATAAGARAR